MSDVKSKKWSLTAAEFKFKPDVIKPRYTAPTFLSSDSTYTLGVKAAKICIKCKEIFPLENCSNCGSDQFVPGITTERTIGLFCHKCEQGQSRWTCPNCQTSNPINKSLAEENSGCFIATAVYGNYDGSSLFHVGSLKSSLPAMR